MTEMSHVKIELNFLQYLHEKAQESRNKEMQGCLMFLAGALFFVGGTLETLSLTENPEWFIFIPYHTEPIPGAMLGLTLIISGLSLMVFGIVTAMRWRVNRRWYMKELRKASSEKWDELTRKRTVEISASPMRKPKKNARTEWWVYENWAATPERVRIHRGTCRYCNHGSGINPNETANKNMKWWGPYSTWRKAWKVAQQLGREDTAFCKKCCKQLNEIVEETSIMVDLHRQTPHPAL